MRVAATASSSTTPLSYTLHNAMNAINAEAGQALTNQSVQYQALEDRLDLLQRSLNEFCEKLSAPKLVCNNSSQVVHRADISPIADSLVLRCTPCGWQYGVQNSTRRQHLPEGMSFRLIFSRCLPTVRSELSAHSVAQSSDSSSSTDESS